MGRTYGMVLDPKLGERLSWGMYDIPSRKCSHVYDMQVTGKAKVHGIEGVELTAREASYSDKNEVINRTFVAQLQIHIVVTLQRSEMMEMFAITSRSLTAMNLC